MIELEHADLFKPPEDTTAVVIPVSSERWESRNGKALVAPMKVGYAAKARARWPCLPRQIGQHRAVRSNDRAHPLTTERDGRIILPGNKRLRPSYHLIALVTREFTDRPMDSGYLCDSLHALVRLCEGQSYLKEGNIVLPQFFESLEKPWGYWRKYAEIWLANDRFVAIRGKAMLKT